ncbi:uncharacterized protein LOC123584920 [Leopardus geoffroyi]|uniref:uncharacterized protein LOC123584920 n=1 Tax=Leopardus geoffroyi TaxID=46844 RepID=UPI001E25D587|nr:uncharacterized protein LOC123584920 [Leopardus geoffroyi]
MSSCSTSQQFKESNSAMTPPSHLGHSLYIRPQEQPHESRKSHVGHVPRPTKHFQRARSHWHQAPHRPGDTKVHRPPAPLPAPSACLLQPQPCLQRPQQLHPVWNGATVRPRTYMRKGWKVWKELCTRKPRWKKLGKILGPSGFRKNHALQIRRPVLIEISCSDNILASSLGTFQALRQKSICTLRRLQGMTPSSQCSLSLKVCLRASVV